MSKASEYLCPCCGGSVKFDSGIQKMKCPYCENVYEVETLEAYAEDLKQDGTDDSEWDQTEQVFDGEEQGDIKVYRCNYCGGEIMADLTTSATTCPYCDNPVVVLSSLKGQWKPEYVIPFKLDKKRAVSEFKKHLLHKHFLPKPFKSIEHFEEIKGVYVPFWLFDSDIKANIRFKATKVRTWHSGNYDYTETSYYSVVRGGRMAFEKIAVDGSSQMPDDLMESIEPFDFKEAVPFNTGYLAGYVADKYDVDDHKSVTRVNNRILHSVDNAFKSDVRGYSSVKKEGGNIDYNTAKAVYALYPVWILTTRYEDKNYIFAMNGQTGKFVGDLPLDKKKYAQWLGFGTLSCTLLFTVAGMIMSYLAH